MNTPAHSAGHIARNRLAVPRVKPLPLAIGMWLGTAGALLGVAFPAVGQPISITADTGSTVSVSGNRATITTTRSTAGGTNAVNVFSQFRTEAGTRVDLVMPTAAANLINVNYASKFDIGGQVNALKNGAVTGNVWFLSPLGVAVGPSGVVNAGALHLGSISQAQADQFKGGANPDALISGIVGGAGGYALGDGAIDISGRLNATTGSITLRGKTLTLAPGALLQTGQAANLAETGNGDSAVFVNTNGIEQGVHVQVIGEGANRVVMLAPEGKVSIQALDQAGLTDIAGQITGVAAAKVRLVNTTIDTTDGALAGGGEAANQGVSIEAKAFTPASPGLIRMADASVSLDGVTIHSVGNVKVQANASAANRRAELTDFFNTDITAQQTASNYLWSNAVLGGVIDKLQGLAADKLGINVLPVVAISKAVTEIKGSTLTSTGGKLEVKADSAGVSNSALKMKPDEGSSSTTPAVAVLLGLAKSDAGITIDGSTVLRGNSSLAVAAGNSLEGMHELEVEAAKNRAVGAFLPNIMLGGADVTVAQGAQLSLVNPDGVAAKNPALSITAVNKSDYGTSVEASAEPGAKAGIAVALAIPFTHAKVSMAGSADAGTVQSVKVNAENAIGASILIDNQTGTDTHVATVSVAPPDPDAKDPGPSLISDGIFPVIYDLIGKQLSKTEQKPGATPAPSPPAAPGSKLNMAGAAVVVVGSHDSDVSVSGSLTGAAVSVTAQTTNNHIFDSAVSSTETELAGGTSINVAAVVALRTHTSMAALADTARITANTVTVTSEANSKKDYFGGIKQTLATIGKSGTPLPDESNPDAVSLNDRVQAFNNLKEALSDPFAAFKTDLFSGYVAARGEGGKTAINGSVGIWGNTNLATTSVAGGAVIAKQSAGEGSLTVTANSASGGIVLSGDVLARIEKFNDAIVDKVGDTVNDKIAAMKSRFISFVRAPAPPAAGPSPAPPPAPAPAAKQLNTHGGDSETGVGASYVLLLDTQNSSATVAGGATLDWAGGDVTVKASNQKESFNIGANAGISSSVGLTGTVVHNIYSADTTAAVAEGANITARTLALSAVNNTQSVSAAVAISKAQKSVGVALAINSVEAKTRALLGDPLRTTLAGLPGTAPVTVSSLAVNAVNGGSLIGIGVAGSLSEEDAKSKASGTPPPPAANGANPGDNSATKVLSDDTGGFAGAIASATGGIAGISGINDKLGNTKANVDPSSSGGIGNAAAAGASKNEAGGFGLGVSGAIVWNAVNQTADAVASGRVAFAQDAGPATLLVDAQNRTSSIAVGGAATITKTKAGQSSAGVAGAVTVNDLRSTANASVKAFRNDGDLSLAQVTARSTGEQVSVGLAPSITQGSSGSKSVTVAGGVSITIAANNTSARIDNSLLDMKADEGDVSLTATDASNIGTGGGALVIGGDYGVGLAFTYAKVGNTVQAVAQDSTLAAIDGATGATTAAGHVDILAYNPSRIVAVAAAGGGSTSDNSFSLMGSAVANDIGNTLRAGVYGGVIKAQDGVVLATGDDPSLRETGLVYTYEDPANTFRDRDENGNDRDNAIGSGIIGIAGNVTVGKSSAVGLSVAWNRIRNDFAVDVAGAEIDGGTQFLATSTSASNIVGVSAGASVSTSGKFAVTGSLTLNEINNKLNVNLDSRAGNQSSVSADAVTLQATDQAQAIGVAGAVSVSLQGSLAMGAAITYGNIANTTGVLVDGASVTAKNGNLTLDAANGANNLNIAATIGASAKGFAFMGAAAAATVKNSTTATVRDAASLSATGGLARVAAEDNSHSFTLGLSLAGAQTAGAGIGVAVNSIDNDTRANVAGSGITARNIAVTATSTNDIQSNAIGLGGGGQVGVGGSISVNLIDSDTVAHVYGGSTLSAGNNLLVSADGADILTNISGGVGVGIGAVGVGASVAVNLIRSNISALVDDATLSSAAALGAADQMTVYSGKVDPNNKFFGSTVVIKGGANDGKAPSSAADAQVGEGIGFDESQYQRAGLVRQTESSSGVAVVASAQHELQNLSVNVGVGGAVGVAANVNVNLIQGQTTARATDSTLSNTGGGSSRVLVRAADHGVIDGVAGSVGIGPSAVGVGAGVDVESQSRTTTAQVLRGKVLGGNGGADVDARSTRQMRSFGIGVGVGLGAGVALAGNVTINENATFARVTDVAEFKAARASITAGSATDMLAVNTGVGGGIAGVAAAVGVLVDRSSTGAYLEGSTVAVTNAVQVKAASRMALDEISIAGGVGAAGVGGSVGVVVSNSLTEAVLGDSTTRGSTVTAGSVLVDSDSDVAVTSIGGALGVGVAGVGAAVVVNYLGNTSSARIGGNVTAGGDITVKADTQRDLTGISAALGAGAVGATASVVVNVVGSGVDAATQERLNEKDTVNQGSANNFGGEERLNTGLESYGLSGNDLSLLNAKTRTSFASSISSLEKTEARVVGGAVIKSNAGNVALSATDTTDALIFAGGVAVGAVGVGGAVAVGSFGQAVQTRIDAGASVNAKNKVSLDAVAQTSPGSLNNSLAANAGAPSVGINVNALQGSGGFGAAVAASVASGTSNVNATTEVAGSITAGTVELGSQDKSSIRANSVGAAGSVLASVGVSDANVYKNGLTRVRVTDGASVTGTSVKLDAARTGSVFSQAAGGAVAGVASVNASIATAEQNGEVTAEIGAATVSGGALNVKASSTGIAEANTWGISVAVLGAGGLSVSSARNTVDVTARLAATRLDVTTANVLATLGNSTPLVRSRAQTSSFAGLVAVAGSSSTNEVSGDVVASAEGVTTSAPGASPNVSVTANREAVHSTNATGMQGAVAAVGDIGSSAKNTGTSRASFSSATGAKMGSVYVSATDRSTFNHSITGGGGGLVAQTGGTYHETDNGQAVVEIGSTYTGSLTGAATHITSSKGNLTSNAVIGLAAFGGGETTLNVASSATTLIRDGASITVDGGQAVLTSLVNTQLASTTDVGANGGLSVAGGKSTNAVFTNSIVRIGNNAVLAGRNDAAVWTLAQTEFTLDNGVTAKAITGLGGTGADTVTGAIMNTRVQMGSGSRIATDGTVNLETRTKGLAAETAVASSGGLLTGSYGGAKLDLGLTQVVEIGAGAAIRAEDNVTLTSGGGNDGILAVARADTYTYSLVPAFKDPYGDVSVINLSAVNIAPDAVVESFGNVDLNAVAPGVSAVGSAIAKNIYTEAANAIGSALSGTNVAVETNRGTVARMNSARVTNDGAVRAGINPVVDIVIDAPSDLLAWSNGAAPVVHVRDRNGQAFAPDKMPVSWTHSALNLGGELNTRFQQIKDALESADLTPFYRATLEAERDRLIQQAEQLGIYNAGTGTIANYSTPQIEFSDIIVGGGNVNIKASGLQGAGSFFAAGGPRLSILDRSPSYLRLNKITVRPDGGLLNYNGLNVSDTGQIAAANPFPSSVLDITQLRPVAFSKLDVLGGSQVLPLVDIFLTADRPNVGGVTYAAPTLHVTKDITNVNGNIRLRNEYGSVLVQGTGGSDASLRAQAVEISAGGNVVLAGGTLRNTGGAPEAQYANLCADSCDLGTAAITPVGGSSIFAYGNVWLSAETINVNGTVQSGRDKYEITIDQAMADSITARADEQYISNGQLMHTVRASEPGAPSTFAAFGRGLSQSGITAQYNLLDRQLEIDPISFTGGDITLVGRVISTGAGSLKAFSGYGEVSIQNNSNMDIKLGAIDNARPAVGKIRMIEPASGPLGGVIKTEWTKRVNEPVEVRSQINLGGGLVADVLPDGRYNLPILSPDVFFHTGKSYTASSANPLANSAYTWITGKYSSDTVYESYLGFATATLLNYPDAPAYINPAFLYRAGQTTLTFNWDQTVSFALTPGQYTSSQVFITLAPPVTVNGPPDAFPDLFTFGDRTIASGSNFTRVTDRATFPDTNNPYGLHTYPTHHVITNNGATTDKAGIFAAFLNTRRDTAYFDTAVNTLRADRPIDIGFIGRDTGLINVQSAQSTVRIGGKAENGAGLININAQRILSAGGSLASPEVTLNAATTIGDARQSVALTRQGATALRATVADAGKEYTTGERNGIFISSQGDLVLDEARVATGLSDLRLDGRGSILGRGNMTVQADRITLNAAAHIGSTVAGQALSIQQKVTGAYDDGIANALRVNAGGDINLVQKNGDLWIHSVTSTSGGTVKLEAEDGRLLNGNPVVQRDTRSDDVLRALWDRASITGAAADAFNVAQVDAFKDAKVQEYRDYWNFRGIRQEGGQYVADAFDPATFQFSFSAADRSRLAAAGLTEEGIAQREQLQTDRLLTLHARHGGTPASAYNAGYARADVVFSADETRGLAAGFKWTEEQLRNTVSRAVFDKDVTSTVSVIRAPNVSGGTLVLKSSAGQGREQSAAVVLDLDALKAGALLTDAQKLALAAAEPADVDKTGETATGGIWKILVNDPLTVQSTQSVSVSSGNGRVFINSPEALRITQVDATDEVRLKGGNGVSVAPGAGAGGYNVSATSLLVEGGNGGIGAADAPIRLKLLAAAPGAADDIRARAAQGIYLENLSSDVQMAIGSIFSQNGEVNLKSASSIVDQRGEGTRAIDARSVTLDAVGSIGAADRPLTVLLGGTDGDNLVATSQTGGVYISSADSIRAGALSAASGVEVSSGGSLSLNGPVTSTGAVGDVRLTATGELNLVAGGLVSGGAAVSLLGAAIDLAAGSTVQGVAVDMASITGNIALAGVTATGSALDAIRIDAAGDLARNNAPGMVDLLTSHAAGGVVIQAGGSVATLADPLGVDTRFLTLDAGGDVGLRADGTGLLTVEHVNSTGGSVSLTRTPGSLTVTDAIRGAGGVALDVAGDLGGGTVASSGGGVSITAGSIGPLAGVEAAAGVVLQSGGTLEVAGITAGADVQVAAAGDARIGSLGAGGDAGLSSGGVLVLGAATVGGSIDAAAALGMQLGDAAAGGSARYVTEAGDLTINGAVTSIGDMTMIARTGNIDTGASPSKTIASSAGSVTVYAGLELQPLDLVSAFANASVTAGGDAGILRLTAGGNADVTTLRGNLRIDSTQVQGSLLAQALLGTGTFGDTRAGVDAVITTGGDLALDQTTVGRSITATSGEDLASRLLTADIAALRARDSLAADTMNIGTSVQLQSRLVRGSALHTGTAGPMGMDVTGWQDALASNVLLTVASAQGTQTDRMWTDTGLVSVPVGFYGIQRGYVTDNLVVGMPTMNLIMDNINREYIPGYNLQMHSLDQRFSLRMESNHGQAAGAYDLYRSNGWRVRSESFWDWIANGRDIDGLSAEEWTAILDKTPQAGRDYSRQLFTGTNFPSNPFEQPYYAVVYRVGDTGSEAEAATEAGNEPGGKAVRSLVPWRAGQGGGGFGSLLRRVGPSAVNVPQP